MRHVIAVLAGCLLSVATGTGARAQQSEVPPRSSQSSPKPFEVEAGAGYVLGLGTIAPHQSYDGVPGSGFGITAGFDYRVSWRWAVGIQGQYYDFSTDPSSPARGLAANLGATWHFNRAYRADPWLRVGTGYRLLWEGDSPTGAMVLRHGFELVAVTVGFDAALSDNIGIAPVVGAGLDVFLWQDAPDSIGRPFSTRTGSFICAGLQGRFALGD